MSVKWLVLYPANESYDEFDGIDEAHEYAYDASQGGRWVKLARVEFNHDGSLRRGQQWIVLGDVAYEITRCFETASGGSDRGKRMGRADLYDVPAAQSPAAQSPAAQSPAAQSPAQQSPLEEALTLVEGARQDVYGHPSENLTTTAEMWTAMLRVRGLLVPGASLDAWDVAACMCAVKLARSQRRETGDSPHRDSVTDTAGWAQAGWMAMT